MGSARERRRPIGSMDSRPKKRASLAQLDPLIIDTQNPSHENILDCGYVQETSLGDASMLEPIPENIEISTNYTSVHEDVELLRPMTSNLTPLKNANVEKIGLNGKMRSRLNWIH